MGDPQVPGDSGDYNYASSDEGVAIHGNTLYFADTGNNMVSVIDAATLNPKNYNPAETDIHVGFNPADLAVSPDGTQLWVADTGPQTDPGAHEHRGDLDRDRHGDRDAVAAQRA